MSDDTSRPLASGRTGVLGGLRLFHQLADDRDRARAAPSLARVGTPRPGVGVDCDPSSQCVLGWVNAANVCPNKSLCFCARVHVALAKDFRRALFVCSNGLPHLICYRTDSAFRDARRRAARHPGGLDTEPRRLPRSIGRKATFPERRFNQQRSGWFPAPH
jgi:hypothetical protein